MNNVNNNSSNLNKNCNSKEFSSENIFKKDYIEELLKCKNEMELVNCLKKKNIEITESDAKFMLDQVNKYREKILNENLDYQKIPDSCLEDVSGGERNRLLHYLLLPVYVPGYLIGASPVIVTALYHMLQGVYDQLRGR